jgi:Protein of unknown function (DUF4058)
MPSPFPGMDPYLEDRKLWPSVQEQLVNSLYHILLPGLVDRYRAKVALRRYVTELALFTSVVREPHDEPLIEIHERNSDRLVTLIDLVSPTNKTTRAGREAYLATRQQLEGSRASAVEIDLLTQGSALLEYSRDGLPEFDYTVTVTRATAPGRFEIYTTTVQKRLPKFKLPLASDDRDAVLDLQDVFRRAYDTGGFHKQIDYKTPMPSEVKLSDANHDWIDAMLKQQKYR